MKGFTIVELIVSIAIFAVMTALVIAKYGTFNQSTLLTNIAYDMALTIRTAQTYGLSVKSTSSSVNDFGSAYGIHFSNNSNNTFTFFADTITGSGLYKYNDGEAITKYTLTQGVTIDSICLGSELNDCTKLNSEYDSLDIVYKRPNPNAIFNVTSIDALTLENSPTAFIELKSSDGTNKVAVYIRKNGQISVGN